MSEVVIKSTRPNPLKTTLSDPEKVLDHERNNEKLRAYLLNDMLYTYLEIEPNISYQVHTPPRVECVECGFSNINALDSLPDWIERQIREGLSRIND